MPLSHPVGAPLLITKRAGTAQKTGIIKVTFDAQNTGYFQKSVIIESNAEKEARPWSLRRGG